VKTRAQLLSELKPLPAGYSGTIRITNYQLRDFGSFAVATYVMDEHETAEGHMLHAMYRATDTWRKAPAGWRLAGSMVLAIPKDPPAIFLPRESLRAYAGDYSLSDATRMTIRVDGDHLVIERAGRPPQTWQSEAPDVFFTAGRPRVRHIFLRGADDAVKGFADRREGEDLPWKKL